MRSGRFGRNVAAACAIALLPLCAADDFIRADDAARIKRTGDWEWTSHRYAANGALVTTEDGASLEFTVRGQTVLWLDTLTPPNNFGPPELGRIEVFVDGVQTQSVRPRLEDREVRLALASTGEHRVRLVHRAEPDGAGCRVVGIRAVDEPSGDVAWTLSGERNQALLDVRAIVHRGGRIAREALVRNWLTGQCRLVGLPAGDGYTLELRASGWNTARTAEFAIHSGGETALAPVYLRREWDVPTDSFVFPRLGHPVVRTAGGEFRVRVQSNRAEIRRVRIVRQQGPATISRVCAFTEDKAARFYYYREGVATMPRETPPGIYDLEVTVEDDGATSVMPSRRCVVVVGAYARDPVFMGFGHLDTWGQYPAEYLARLADIANIVGPDLVLDANDANPAYVAGALCGLEVPFVVTFGNHRAPEPATWFGDPVDIVDFGPEFCVLNFGRPWDSSIADADQLLAARGATRTKIINAFESNAPIAGFLDRHRVALLHYAHGPGPHVAKMGATPTIRVGKVNSESFRIIRFRDGRPVSYTYRGDPVAPIPFAREAVAPIRVSYQPANDGTHAGLSATVQNDLAEPLPHARVVFVLPKGKYEVEGGTVESCADSDDGRFSVLTARGDVPSQAAHTLRVR